MADDRGPAGYYVGPPTLGAGYYEGRPMNRDRVDSAKVPLPPQAEAAHQDIVQVPGYYKRRVRRDHPDKHEAARVHAPVHPTSRNLLGLKPNWSRRWRRREEKAEQKEVKLEKGEKEKSTPDLPDPYLSSDDQDSAQAVPDYACITDPSASHYDPLSACKMVVAVAGSLVDKAYSLGAVTDSRRQMLLDQLRSIDSLSSHTWKFRDAVEELEDAIDELDYLSFEKNVSNPIPISKFIKSKIIDKLARLNIPMSSQKRLRNALGLLEDVLTSGYDFGPTPLPFATSIERYPMWIDSAGGYFGRDREIEQTVLWLSKDTDIPVSIYALVGIAGIGKTKLAYIVSQDPRVSASFDNVVWINVPSDFYTDKIATEILNSITMRYYFTYDPLADTLRHRKILLILDDVWEDNSIEKWKTLWTHLKVCKKGSRVLLTTRMESVVDMAARAMETQAEYLKLDDLDEDDSFILLKKRLASQVDSKDYNNLLLIGEQIAKNIGGCPFVINAVASWLGLHMEVQHWITVLQKGWQHIEQKDMIIASFRLSYYYLPTELQACFRYCSIFPKGHKFNKTELARMWTCSGVIPFSSLEQENVGEKYFDALVRKSFFCCVLETEPSNGDQKEYYVLHSLVHDLAQVVSQGECARVDNGDFQNVSNTTRHLFIANGSLLGLVRGNFQFLRTLIITNELCLDQETELVLGDVLECSRHLRLLYLDVPSLLHALDRLSR